MENKNILRTFGLVTTTILSGCTLENSTPVPDNIILTEIHVPDYSPEKIAIGVKKDAPQYVVAKAPHVKLERDEQGKPLSVTVYCKSSGGTERNPVIYGYKTEPNIRARSLNGTLWTVSGNLNFQPDNKGVLTTDFSTDSYSKAVEDALVLKGQSVRNTLGISEFEKIACDR